MTIYIRVCLLSYGKAPGLDTCFSPVTFEQRAPRVGPCYHSRLGVNQPETVYGSPAETRLLFSRRERVLTTAEWLKRMCLKPSFRRIPRVSFVIRSDGIASLTFIFCPVTFMTMARASLARSRKIRPTIELVSGRWLIFSYLRVNLTMA